jgi:hypothetical protein
MACALGSTRLNIVFSARPQRHNSQVLAFFSDNPFGTVFPSIPPINRIKGQTASLCMTENRPVEAVSSRRGLTASAKMQALSVQEATVASIRA